MDTQNDKPDDRTVQPSRRRFVGTVAAGLAVPALAQAQGGGQAAAGAPLPLTPPSYPKPPFQRQKQDWPGLASKMTPRPDHGETTYRGSGRLTGRRALITGGDS